MKTGALNIFWLHGTLLMFNLFRCRGGDNRLQYEQMQIGTHMC